MVNVETPEFLEAQAYDSIIKLVAFGEIYGKEKTLEVLNARIASRVQFTDPAETHITHALSLIAQAIEAASE